jgi:hypothetical protein|tara:strand:- start:202 stop:387 length:186 start_codon:yes stop_codon:yes gene_type:complete
MSPLATTLRDTLQNDAKQFDEMVDLHLDVPWRDFLRAWGELREADVLKRDDAGAYYIGGAG